MSAKTIAFVLVGIILLISGVIGGIKAITSLLTGTASALISLLFACAFLISGWYLLKMGVK